MSVVKCTAHVSLLVSDPHAACMRVSLPVSDPHAACMQMSCTLCGVSTSCLDPGTPTRLGCWVHEWPSLDTAKTRATWCCTLGEGRVRNLMAASWVCHGNGKEALRGGCFAACCTVACTAALFISCTPLTNHVIHASWCLCVWWGVGESRAWVS